MIERRHQAGSGEVLAGNCKHLTGVCRSFGNRISSALHAVANLLRDSNSGNLSYSVILEFIILIIKFNAGRLKHVL